jgi:hypothetical protein
MTSTAVSNKRAAGCSGKNPSAGKWLCMLLYEAGKKVKSSSDQLLGKITFSDGVAVFLCPGDKICYLFL